MAEQNGFDTRTELLDLLLARVAEDVYPSVTMLNMIEERDQPDEGPAYAAILMQKVSEDTYPSIPMLKRLIALSS